jgi:hypothetical protein
MGAKREVRLVETAPQPDRGDRAHDDLGGVPVVVELAAGRGLGGGARRGARRPAQRHALQDPRPSVEVGVEVFEAIAARGRVVASALPGGAAAMTIAPGAPSTEGLASAHDRVRRWAA